MVSKNKLPDRDIGRCVNDAGVRLELEVGHLHWLHIGNEWIGQAGKLTAEKGRWVLVVDCKTFNELVAPAVDEAHSNVVVRLGTGCRPQDIH